MERRRGFFQKSTIVKKSPVVIVKTFIVLQLTAVAVFFLASIMTDYGDIYERLPLSKSLSFHVIEAGAIFIFETILIFYIFFSWYKEHYEISQDKVTHARGIVFRRRNVIPIKTISSISYRQGPLAKLTKYGTVELKEKDTNDKFLLENISEPQNYVDLLVQLKGVFGGNNNKEEDVSIESLISYGEHERMEFKSSFRWDYNQNKVNKSLERAVMKTVVAFLNSGGGQLLIGVNDSGNVTGLEQDYRSLPKPGADGFQNHFTNVFHAMVGPEYRHYTELNFLKVGDKDCCLVRVEPATKPAYLKWDSNEEFFIRTGNGTTALKLSEVTSYIDSHWRAKLL